MRVATIYFLAILNIGFHAHAVTGFFPYADEELSGRPIRGVYEVPVAENLKEFASYPVKYKTEGYQADQNKLAFYLPATLVGEEKMIVMTKVVDQEGKWNGPNANAHCQTIGRNFKCTVLFNDLEIDPIKQEIAIRENFQTEAEITGRLQVASHFSSEPIGIISYKLRGRVK